MKKINVRFKMKDVEYSNQYLFDTNLLKEIDDGIYLYQNNADNFLHSSGIVLAGATVIERRQPTLFGMDYKEYYNAIVTDSAFGEMPKFVKEFLIYHEAGHIKKNHLQEKSQKELLKMILKRICGITPVIEYEADAYSASIIGKDKAKNAIKFLLLYTNLPLISKFEFIKRYLILR